MNKDHNHKLGQLSLEQQFQLQIIEREIEHLSLNEAKEYLREAFRQIMVQENMCREMFKECFLSS
ncbi:MAG: NblA/ycf18 family protein [Cyanobacteria bacterium P01_A01_bin.40]